MPQRKHVASRHFARLSQQWYGTVEQHLRSRAVHHRSKDGGFSWEFPLWWLYEIPLVRQFNTRFCKMMPNYNAYFTNLDFPEIAGVPFPETKKLPFGEIQDTTAWHFETTNKNMVKLGVGRFDCQNQLMNVMTSDWSLPVKRLEGYWDVLLVLRINGLFHPYKGRLVLSPGYVGEITQLTNDRYDHFQPDILVVFLPKSWFCGNRTAPWICSLFRPRPAGRLLASRPAGRQSCQPAGRPLPCGPAGRPAPCSPAGRPNWLAGWLVDCFGL